MENNLNKITYKEKFFSFLNENKKKIISLVIILLVTIITFTLFKNNQKKQHLIASEKYIKAGIYLTSKEYNKAKKNYEEIILSGDKFYSIFFLNNILEKNLENDNKKILSYFEKVEKNVSSENQNDLLMFKKHYSSSKYQKKMKEKLS